MSGLLYNSNEVLIINCLLFFFAYALFLGPVVFFSGHVVSSEHTNNEYDYDCMLVPVRYL